MDRDWETEGETLDPEEVFGTVEAVKTVSDLFIPVGGEILEFNTEVEDQPELLNSDPYGEGWIIKVKVTDDNMDNLMTAQEYIEMVG